MRRRWVWVMLALTLAAGTAACSSARGNAPVPASSPTSVRPSAANTAVALTAARSGRAAVLLPDYQPSKVISEAAGRIQLSSIDSVSKVTSFYENAVKSRGWRIVYNSKSAAQTSIVAMHGTTGVGILISRAGQAGTSIAVIQCQC
jgi:hypothetical protein